MDTCSFCRMGSNMRRQTAVPALVPGPTNFFLAIALLPSQTSHQNMIPVWSSAPHFNSAPVSRHAHTIDSVAHPPPPTHTRTNTHTHTHTLTHIYIYIAHAHAHIHPASAHYEAWRRLTNWLWFALDLRTLRHSELVMSVVLPATTTPRRHELIDDQLSPGTEDAQHARIEALDKGTNR